MVHLTSPAERHAAPPALTPAARRVIACFLVVQLLVPVIVLVRSRTGVFEVESLQARSHGPKVGWQMYAESPLPRTYTGVRRDGSETQVDPTAVVGGFRGRALYADSTFVAVCEARTELVRLRWQGIEHRCR